ncbi:MAG: APC family permease [Thermoprotei archaeon]
MGYNNGEPRDTDDSLKPRPPSQGVFVREATGLVKSASLLDAFSLNISNMSIGALLGVMGLTLVLLPSTSGVNLVYASILGFLAAIPQIVVYTMMSERVPRTGGDYVWVTRSLGGFLGTSVSFMGYTLETMAYMALIVLSAVFAIGSVGLALGQQGFLGLAVPGNVQGAQPYLQFAVGALIFASLIALNIFKPKAGYRFVTALTAFGVTITIVAIGVLLHAGRSGVAAYINSLGISGVTYSSLASGYSGPSFNFAATISILPLLAAFVYPWLNAAPAVGGEIKNRRALKLSVPLAALTSFALLTASFATLYYVGGQAFINQALSNPTLVYDYSFNFWTLAMGVAGNTALATLIGLGWIVWNIGILAYGIIVVSRYLFAGSFDRFLPEKLSYVSPKWNSPLVAHIVDLAITVALVGLAAVFYGGFSGLFGAIIASMIYFAFVGVSATIYALRKEKGAAKAALTTAGALNAAVFLYIAYQFLSAPGVWGITSLSEAYVVGTFLAGAAIYTISKRVHTKRGLNIALAYKEIPPE